MTSFLRQTCCASAIALSIVAGSCNRAAPVVIKEISLLESGTTAQAGRSVGIGVAVENPGGGELEYRWTSQKGGSFDEPRTRFASNIYTPPALAGIDVVTVEVHGSGSSVSKSLQVEVVGGLPPAAPAGEGARLSRPLLSGRVEPFGRFRKSCPASATDSLAMRIQDRAGDFAMCCTHLSPMVEAFAGDTLVATIGLQQPERQVHVKIETDGAFGAFHTVFLHDRDLPAGTSSLTRTLEPRDLAGNDALTIARFCVAALDQGPLQTVTVSNASLATSVRGQIQFPRTETGALITARGQIRQLPSDGFLWLAIRKGELVWPKEPAPTVTGSTWTATVSEGGTPAGGALELVLYFMRADGNRQVLQWLEEGKRTSSFPGLRSIAGAVVLHSVPLRMAAR